VTSACRLCSNLIPHASSEVWDTPLFQSANFVAVPSLGALVEGWLLLIPKRHVLSLGSLPDSMHEELNEFKGLLYVALTQYYGEVCAFEHGPSKEKSAVGCGVDHAHLHIVPMTLDLSIEVTPYLPAGVTWAPADLRDCQNAHQRGLDYLYFEQPTNGRGRIAMGRELGSQLFRRAIAAHLEIPEEYNWREHAQVPNILETIKVIRGWQERNHLDSQSCFVAA
jgi:ATP adenylyltransferase